jgi:tetratricopeptide (TPR) repeat protein
MSAGPATPPTVTGIYAGADLAVGSVLADRYRIESLLGVGGMGVVYRAFDQSLQVPVAIKLLRPELAHRAEAFERFRQELLLARQVSSPNVVRIHDIARDGARWFISMDLIEGEPLDRILDRRGALAPDEALAIARQLALGLQAAHARGVVHRDLKPGNVLVDSDGQAWIADFGVARSLRSSGMTHSGAVIGTPDYLSPEQARGAPVDARSDLYALGLLLYEMLSGKLPFNAATPSESITQRLAGPPPPLRDAVPALPPWIERLVAHLLRPNPAHRFRDAGEVIAAIDLRRAPRDWRAWRRRGAWAIGATLLVAAVVLVPPRLQAPSPTTAATPPAARVLVLEQAPPDPDQALWLEAVADRVRLAIELAGGVAVVDAERSRQAVQQLGLRDGKDFRLQALDQELPGARLVRLALDLDADTPRLRAWLREPGAAEQALALPNAPGEALAALVAHVGATEAGAPIRLPGDDAMRAQAEAQRLRLEGRVGDALERWREAVALAPDDALLWLGLAEAAWFAGAPDAAAEALQRGRAVAEPRLLPRFDAHIALIDGDIEAATGALRARLAAVPDDLAAQLRLGYAQGELGDLPGALATLAEVAARDPGEPRAWFLRGKYSILRGDVRAAVDEYLVRALVLYKRGRNAHGEGETVNALGVGYARLGQMDDAEEQYRKALELRRAVGNRRGVASSLRNLAQIATVRGRFAEAERDLVEARGLFEALGDGVGLAAVDNERGLLAEERGDHAAALAAYRDALRGRESLGDAFGAAESLNNIGFAHFQLGDYDSAQVFWRQAEEAFVRLDDLNGVTRVQQNLGLLETARGHWAQARELLQRSLDTAQRLQLVEEEAVTRRNLAELDIVQGRLADAGTQLQRAEALFVERDDLRGRVDAGLLRTRLHLAAADVPGADAALASIEPLLEQGSSEQRVIAALLRLERHHLAREALPRSRLREAEARLAEGGTRLLRLQFALLRDPAAPGLAAEIDALDHHGLWLRLQQAMMQLELEAGERAAAARRYADVRRRLPGGEGHADAWRLHRLGARTIEDAEAAQLARDAADAALQRMLDAAPEALRTTLREEAARDGG